ncbi:hypothetical protein ERO13_A08G083762v2 [Gossypium hirsutum]|uniref:Protein SET DOMAIN GROUP 40 isoform X1 n=1 Tax=Gossypium hirsutum TaxID=3635 RepID=A0A1U8L1D2_GOSHI|nr:protein SET DOMAIN GROUP 40-like isoform X1 [Gossypium hirsutum]KAG4187095.1 hypothetical protein ERO13_A08G083762v2 [Gossypium hirsutum]KAG4187096.1 hypothetical protein ERO13_A08G083762v2 [Gossypium hirsutum]
MKNYWQGGVCLAFADEVLCWLYGTVKESKILISISTSTICAAQKAVTKAKYEWEQAFTLMKELKLKPPLLTFRAWIWATGTVQIIARDKILQTSRNICYLCKHFLVR